MSVQAALISAHQLVIMMGAGQSLCHPGIFASKKSRRFLSAALFTVASSDGPEAPPSLGIRLFRTSNEQRISHLSTCMRDVAPMHVGAKPLVQ